MVNCKRCEYMAADNGNCTAVGGFCMAVPAAHCVLLQEYMNARLTPAEVHSLWGEWNAMMSVLNSIGGGYERLRQLAEADKAGRLVVLPVRPVLTQSIRSMLYIIEDGEIVEDSLCEALVGMGSNGEINTFYTTLSDQISFEQADIGKTVFLTREEAEKALEEEKDD